MVALVVELWTGGLFAKSFVLGCVEWNSVISAGLGRVRHLFAIFYVLIHFIPQRSLAVF